MADQEEGYKGKKEADYNVACGEHEETHEDKGQTRKHSRLKQVLHTETNVFPALNPDVLAGSEGGQKAANQEDETRIHTILLYFLK